MIRWFDNQKGSALILVLLTITVISIVSITIFTSTSSNMSQIKQSESTIQATSMAKIGLPHSQNYIASQFNDLLVASTSWLELNKMTIIDNQIMETCGYFLPDEELNNGEYEEQFEKEFQQCAKEVVIPYLEEAIEANLDKYFNSTIEYNDLYQILRESYNVMVDDIKIISNSPNIIENGLNFSIKSTGVDISDNKDVELVYNLLIPFYGGFRIEYIPVDGQKNPFRRTFPSGDDIEDPDPNNIFASCITGSYNNVKCQFNAPNINPYPLGNGAQPIINSVVKVKGNLLGQSINNSRDSTIYITGNLTLTNNSQSLNNVRLHIDGNANIANMNNISNTFIEIKGEANLGHLQNASATTIFIGGKSNIATTNSSQLDLNNGSIVYALQDTTITGKVSVRTGSIICVHGRLNIVQEPTWDRSPNSGIFAKSTNNTNFVQTDPVLFRKACYNSVKLEELKLIISPDYDFEWDIDSTNIRY